MTLTLFARSLSFALSLTHTHIDSPTVVQLLALLQNADRDEIARTKDDMISMDMVRLKKLKLQDIL